MTESKKFTDLNTFERWSVKKYGSVWGCEKFTDLNTFERSSVKLYTSGI